LCLLSWAWCWLQTIEGVGTCTATSIVGSKQHATFEFEDPPGKRTTISKFALLTDISLQPSVVIESSFFGNNRARGTLIKTSNVVVKDSVYNATSDHCILAFPDGCYWFAPSLHFLSIFASEQHKLTIS
jgi:hypothetical protein